jgi:hypothetical protein
LEQATKIFAAIFHRSPHGVGCDCCGRDFSATEYDTLRHATAHDRKCQLGPDGNYSEEGPSFSYCSKCPVPTPCYTCQWNYTSRYLTLDNYTKEHNCKKIRIIYR